MSTGSARTRFADVRRYADVPSTNSLAAGLLRAGAAPGVVVVADHQTAGRGRLERRWEAPPGSSLLVSVTLDATWLWDGRLPLATVALALAASDACEQVAGVRPSLKWPNDLLAGGGKVGGILAEAVEGGAAVVAGLGLNTGWGGVSPPEPGISLDSLTGAPADRDALLDALLGNLDRRLEGDHAALLDDYRVGCETLGRAVRVETPAGTLQGTAVEVTGDGLLVVEDEIGARHTVSAGDVIHLR